MTSWRHYLLWVWKRKCPHLNGRRLPTKKFKGLGKGKWIKEEDLEAIKESVQVEQDHRRELTERKNLPKVKRPRKKRAIELFDGIGRAPDGEELLSVTAIANESRKKMVPIPEVWLYLRIKPSTRERPDHGIPKEWPDEFKAKFPDGYVPSVPMHVPDSIDHMIPGIRRSHVEILYAIGRSLQKKKPPADHVTVDQFLDENHWRSALANRNNSGKHIRISFNRVQTLLNGCGFRSLADVLPSRVEGWLALERRADRLSIVTSNYYLRDAKSFLRWLVDDGRVARNPPSSQAAKCGSGSPSPAPQLARCRLPRLPGGSARGNSHSPSCGP